MANVEGGGSVVLGSSPPPSSRRANNHSPPHGLHSSAPSGGGGSGAAQPGPRGPSKGPTPPPGPPPQNAMGPGGAHQGHSGSGSQRMGSHVSSSVSVPVSAPSGNVYAGAPRSPSRGHSGMAGGTHEMLSPTGVGLGPDPIASIVVSPSSPYHEQGSTADGIAPLSDGAPVHKSVPEPSSQQKSAETFAAPPPQHPRNSAEVPSQRPVDDELEAAVPHLQKHLAAPASLSPSGMLKSPDVSAAILMSPENVDPLLINGADVAQKVPAVSADLPEQLPGSVLDEPAST